MGAVGVPAAIASLGSAPRGSLEGLCTPSFWDQLGHGGLETPAPPLQAPQSRERHLRG